jgi:prepilin-type N-terminal cleavage/methylation domain-containing protein
MTQGSNMTIGHQGMKKGMRNGLSLIEMLISIVLFGLLSTASFKYYKNYYDTSFAAKQARIYIIIDQAGQLNNAFELYTTKNGADPVDVNSLVTDKILTQVPVTQNLISNAGWQLDLNATVKNSDGNDSDVVFYLSMTDGNASNADKNDYCNILTNAADTSWELNTSRASQVTATTHYAAGRTSFFCDANETGTDDDNGTLKLTFVTRIAS